MTPKTASPFHAAFLAALLISGGGLALTPSLAYAADEVVTSPNQNPEYPPYDGGCDGECEGPVRGCDNDAYCGGSIDTPFAAPDAVTPIAGVAPGLTIEPPSEEDDEAKIGNAPITGSGNSDLVRSGGSGR